MSRLLTPAEIAERLRVSTGTVFSLARREALERLGRAVAS